ncbi:Rho guanine nucleotide exchange factor [Malassezia vespertilionis]|uniref:DH domain-containing protein n=1 Tax=Malassezia vespertilionis TaxID=2020962 RepID=A0A2N1JDI5_9BASI|nr:Rho guanine nucleotide exchange factor [Malassezia vespertilionis]PKI84592.1 hypothetical protein MVES_001592 [Malassezia vespertilionis]WFD06346.1 Rho guanine nucleotide exchange factor [Malassezia vespertilionis]
MPRPPLDGGPGAMSAMDELLCAVNESIEACALDTEVPHGVPVHTERPISVRKSSTPTLPSDMPRRPLPKIPSRSVSSDSHMPPVYADHSIPTLHAAQTEIAPQGIGAAHTRPEKAEPPPDYALHSMPFAGACAAHEFDAAALLQGTAVDMSRLSQIAQLLSCMMQRHPLIKGSVVYPLSFTGRMMVSTIESMIQQYLDTMLQHPFVVPPAYLHYLSTSIARSLKTQLFVHEADWDDHPFTCGVGEVYMFFADSATAEKLGHSACTRQLATDLFEAQPHARTTLSTSAAAACTTAPWADLPTGVFAPLTRCYSPTCAQMHAPGTTCYSSTCANAGRGFQHNAVPFDATSEEAPSGAESWVETVPAEIVATIPTAQVSRQNAMHEFIQKETSFLHDLELLEKFATQLRELCATPMAPLSIHTLDAFLADVFGNYSALTNHISAFIDRLHERQREEYPMVDTISDILVDAALEWGSVYTTYVQHYPCALHRLKREIAANPRMSKFVDSCRRDPAAHRHPLDNFLFRPPARLQRYHLHLESILKYTESEEDREKLQLAMEIIDEQCKVAQVGVESAEQRLQLLQYAQQLVPKTSDVYTNMYLQDPKRKLIFYSNVLRRPDGFEFEWVNMVAILLDNVFVLAKRKQESTEDQGGAEERFVYYRKPIPIACLDMADFNDPPLTRGPLSRRWMTTDANLYPFLVRHRFSRESVTLYVPTAELRAEWATKFAQVRHLQSARSEQERLFVSLPLSADTFASSWKPAEAPQELVHDHGWAFVDVACASAFRLADGTNMLAIGTSEGVWIGLHGEPASLAKVLHLRNVTQCALMTQCNRFLVLADRSLVVYDMEALVPSQGIPSSFAPFKLSGNRDVLFFSVGMMDGKETLVYGKRRTNETSIRILQLQLTPIPRPGRGWRKKHTANTDGSTDFCEVLKFYVGYEATNAQFLPDGLMVSSWRGMQRFRFASRTLEPWPLVKSNAREDAVLWALLKQWESAKALCAYAMPGGTLLLCYDRYGAHVDAQGYPIVSDVVLEWEGKAQRVVVYGNYILVFCAAFIEVRCRSTGELCQLIAGRDIKLLSRHDAVLCDPAVREPLLFVQRVKSEAIREDVQCVYELVLQE